LIERRIPQQDAASTPELDTLGRIEAELARLRECRPALDGVTDRAAGIIVAHLACRRSRVIVVRIGLGGRPKYIFRSLNERGATYVINPVVWSCSCPAYHRTGGPCKHVLAAYILYRVARPLLPAED
jgi:hypothetical protein